VFRRVGEGLGIEELPGSYVDWRLDRERHMRSDLAYSPHTAVLYRRYREELGPWRFTLLLRLQALLVPPFVRSLLSLRRSRGTQPAVGAYRRLRATRFAPIVRAALVPSEYLLQVGAMDRR
jgi:hypothetical protein